MDYAIFKNDKEKNEGREALASLTEHPGWKLIAMALQLNAEHFAQQLKEKQDFDNLEQVYAMQDRIDDLGTFQNLPAILIKETEIEPPEEDSDPYGSPAPQETQPNL